MSFVARSFRNSTAMCLSVALLSCGSISSIKPASPSDVVGSRKVIALVSDTQSESRMLKAAGDAGYASLDVSRLDGLDLSMLTFQMPDGVTGPDAITELEAAVPGSVVGINHAYRLQQQESQNVALDYAGDMIGWSENGCRAQVPIGMIDTGIDTTSPALAGAQIQTRTFFDGPSAQARHGTDVATVLAGPNRLREAKIFGANVFGQRDAQGLAAGADALVRALDWLAEEKVRYVNLALAGPYNKLLDLAVDRATANGLILVAAVGNDGPQVEPLFPAGFDGVIAVTAVDANGHIYRSAVRGAHVDVSAPGVDVFVQTGNGARFVTGTSIATPFVTARLAADPALVGVQSVSDIRNQLAATSGELGPAGRDSTFGYGLLQADGACAD